MNSSQTPGHPSERDLFELAEGELPTDRSKPLWGHVARCLECRQRFTEWTDAQRMVAGASVTDVPERVMVRVQQRLEEATRLCPPVWVRWAPAHGAAAVAVAAALLLVVFGLHQSRQKAHDAPRGPERVARPEPSVDWGAASATGVATASAPEASVRGRPTERHPGPPSVRPPQDDRPSGSGSREPPASPQPQIVVAEREFVAGTGPASAAGEALSVGQPLGPGDVLRTGDTDRALIELPDGGQMVVGFDTEIKVTKAVLLGAETDFSVKLAGGEVWAWSPGDGGKISVLTPKGSGRLHHGQAMVRLYGATGAPLRTRRSRLEVLPYQGVVEFTDEAGALTPLAPGHLLVANRELRTLRLEPKAYSRLISVSGGWGRRQDIWRIRTWSVVDLLSALDAPRLVLGAKLGPVAEGEAGLEVLAVARGSNADRAGITAGDRITQLGDRAIETLGDVAAGELLLTSELEPTVTVRRDSAEVPLELPVAPNAPVLSTPADGDIRGLAALAASGDIEQAAGRCLELVDAHPMCAGHWYNLGALREYQRRWADALAAYKKAESLQPGQPLLLTALGRVYGRIGNLTRARTALLAADELGSSGTVGYLLGRVAILGTDLGEAEFWSNDLLASESNDDKAWGELLAGQLAYIRSDHETAAERFGRATRLDPANLLGTLYLAAATDALGHTPPTRELLRPLLRAWPDLLAAVNLMGMTAFWERDWAEAGRWYERGIALEPDSPALLCNRGMVAEAEGRYDEAIDCYQKAIEADVSFVRAYTDLGDVTAETGRLDQAAQHYEKALRLAPGDGDLLDRAVAVYKQLGNDDRAQQLVQRYAPEGGSLVPRGNGGGSSGD